MAGAEVAESKSHAKGKKKKKKRAGVHIDMTPMVDVAMLLLTFFMLTTVFNKPQTMELNLPPDDKTTIEVAASSLITVRVAADFSISWQQGDQKEVNKIAFKDLRSFLAERLRANPKLITLIKVDREATYDNMVNIMDELNLANITRFSLAPMTDADKKAMAKAS